jgi:spermidine synthase
VSDGPVVVERVSTPRGELVLRAAGRHFEVISNGTFLMDTRGGESERLLVAAALRRHPAPGRVLIGGLGVGFSLVAALADDRVEEVVVSEIEPTLLDWHNRYLTDVSGAALADPRTQVMTGDLLALLRANEASFDVACLDIDNGPDWTVTPDNAVLYDDAGTALVASRLRRGGVLSVWSARSSTGYQALLRRHFASVATIEIAVPRGEPDVIFVAEAAMG